MALVTPTDGHVDERVQRGDPCTRALRLLALGAVSVQGQAHDELLGATLADDAGDGLRVLPRRAPPQRQQWRHRAALGIASGDADATLAEVDPEDDAHGRSGAWREGSTTAIMFTP
jgi:hypothetical protein